MNNQKSKPLSIINSSFIRLILGIFLGMFSIVAIVTIALFALFPSDYRFQFIVGPKNSSNDPKFSYKLVVHNDFSAEGDVFHLQDFGKFSGELGMINDWLYAEEANSDTLNISESSKQIRVISVGRMYCPYCLNLYPYLNLMQQRYGNEVTVAAVLYGKYPGELDRTNIQKYLNENLFLFPVGLDTDERFVNTLKVNFVPSTYIVDKDNTIVYFKQGVDNFDRMDKVLEFLTSREGDER